MHDSKRGYQIYYSILALLLTLAVILWVNEHFALKVNIYVSILYTIVPALLLYIFNEYKKNTVTYLVLLGLLPVVGLIFLVSKTNPIHWFRAIIDWIMRYDRTEELYEAVWAYTTLAALSIAVSILFFLIVRKSISRLLLGAVAITLMVASSVLHLHMGKLVVGIGIFYILSILIELSGMLYARISGNKDRKESILYLLPVCVLLAFIAVGLPSKAEPIQWSGVKNVYYSLKDRLNKFVTDLEFFIGEGDGIFSISLSGFSGDGNLDNENIIDDNKVALIVTGNRGLSPIYLTGSVNDVYTGYSWGKSGSDFLEDEQEYQLDYGELLYGLSRLDQELLEEYRLAETKTMKILYNNIRTKTFFYPLKSKWLHFDKSDPDFRTEHAAITFPKAKGDKTSYSVSYFEMNLQGQEFQEMLRQADDFSYNESRPIDYDMISWIEKEFHVRDKENFILRRDDFYDLYKERADIIYKSYTQLPDELPPRIKQLAKKLTEDENTKYDKLKAIESYLVEFEYTLSPGKVPEGADFVDFFIFDNKKGYCTSFATAMAVLGRSIGIPMRYVEGYIVDYEDRNDTGFLVRNSHAHAWAEAYFDGVGWIPFEATPSYHEQRYTLWAPRMKYDEANIGDYYNMDGLIPPINQMMGPNEGAPAEKEGRGTLLWIVVFIVTVCVILIILTSYYLLLRRRYKREFDESDYSIKTYKTLLRILNLLKHEGFTMGRQDTLLILSDRIKDRYKFGEIVFRDVVNIFMAYRYGEEDITHKDYDKIHIFYKGLFEGHKSETKALKLHMEEFVFLIKAYNHSTSY